MPGGGGHDIPAPIPDILELPPAYIALGTPDELDNIILDELLPHLHHEHITRVAYNSQVISHRNIRLYIPII